MAEYIFTGFGFGPIQGGLFVKEAFQSGNFARIVVSEIDSRVDSAYNAGEQVWKRFILERIYYGF